MDELRCRFFGDEEGEAVAATGGGDGLEGGDSNGSGGGWVPSSGGLLKPLGLGEAWTLVEVWREVLKSWAAWVMKGWIERVLVGGLTSSVGPAAS